MSDDPQPLQRSAQRVQATVEALGFSFTVVEYPATTRTAEDPAAAIGCEVGQIAKSLVFRGATSGKPILVVASGSNRVDTALVAEVLGEALERANADFVRARTGFAIGGIPPVGHIEPLTTFLDSDLWQHAVIWAAAGTPHAVFQLTADDLLAMTGGTRIAVT